MEILMRAVVIGVMGAALVLVLRRGSPEIGLLLAIAVSVLVLGFGVSLIRQIIEFAQTLQAAAGLAPELISPVIRTVGIGLITRIAVDICKDAGQGAIASTVELAGTVTALYIALPLMQTVFAMIERLL